MEDDPPFVSFHPYPTLHHPYPSNPLPLSIKLTLGHNTTPHNFMPTQSSYMPTQGSVQNLMSGPGSKPCQ